MLDIAAVVGALGAALVVLAGSRLALVAGFALLAAGAIGLVLAFRPGAALESVALSPAVLAGLLAGTLVLGGFAALLVRFPAVVIPLLLVTAPLRPPLDPDREATLFMTLQPPGMVGYHFPFYLTLAAAVLALIWRVLRGGHVARIPRPLAVPAAAFIALTAVSLSWSEDQTNGISQLMLFIFPFAALVAVVARAPFPRWMPRALALVLVGMGCVFAAIGVIEAVVERNLFYAPNLAETNASTDVFRVTSLFQDPSIYARHLVVAIAVVLVALWARRARIGPAAAVVAVLSAGLYFSYSQSSMLALVVVALAVAFVAGTTAVRRLVVVTLVVFAVAGSAVLAVTLVDGSAQSFTRNRSSLVTSTALVFRDHPLIGVGVGGQAVASRAEARVDTPLGRNESHTTPLTVAAELGIVGLIAYVALLAGAVRLLIAVHRRDPALGLGMAAVLLVLFVHALFYEGFFEEPTTWGLMGATAAALRASERPHGHERERALTDTAAAPAPG